MTSEKIFMLTRYLSLFGIFLALVLIYEQITQTPLKPCNINALINCNSIISGEVSKTFGVPTPLFGLIGYIVIFLSSILMKKRLVFAMATFGLLFCLFIGYKELIILHVICPVCILCEITMISIFSLSGFLLYKKQ